MKPVRPVGFGFQRLNSFLRCAGGGLGGCRLAAQATLREAVAQAGDSRGILKLAELADGSLELCAERQHAQPMLVHKLEARMLLAQLGPQPPDAEARRALVGVVE